MFRRIWQWIKKIVTPKPPPKPPVAIDPADHADPIDRISGEFVDISHHKTIDWNKFNYNDCMMKATEHTSHVDSKFKEFLKECKARGIRVGFYHYYRVQYDPIEQAEHFINTVGLGDFRDAYHLPVIDLEAIGNGSNNDIIRAIPDVVEFAKHVTARTGRKCRIYSGDYLMGLLSSEFRSNGMHYICAEPWIARYPSTPRNYAPWKKAWSHQYSESGKVKWSNDDIDMNRFM